MNHKTLHWGILGPGRIAHTFASDIQLVDGCEITAVASRNSVPRAFAEQYQIARAYQGYQSLLSDTDIDAVYIATPHSCHLDNCIAALEAGKHVLCEKPLVLNTIQANQFKQVIERHPNLFFMEAMWSYFLPAIETAMRWIDEGRIGAVRHLRADFGYPIPYSPEGREYNKTLGGGCLLDMGVYPVALAWRIFQSMPNNISVQAQFAENGVEDDVIVMCDYGQRFATLATSFRYKLPNTAFIIGEQGYIKIPDFWRASECYRYQLDECVEQYSDDRQGSGFEFQIAHMRDCINEQMRESEIMPFKYSFGFQQLMEEIDRQARR